MNRAVNYVAGTAKYVLDGRIVTMGTLGVIPAGSVFVEGRRIVAVQPAGEPEPPGFDQAPRIRTRGTIYPGLIDLHNHLCYNVMPLWKPPKKYTNNGQWKGIEEYQRFITGPTQVLGCAPATVGALVRFVECRELLGGVTTSQGITLSKAPGITKIFRGLIRNVEHGGDATLPPASTKISNPAPGDAPAYVDRLARGTCLLQHLSEGTDDTAREWFLNLRLPEGSWAVNRNFCAIHGTALSEEDWRVMADHGASAVWSPLSNYLLYGDSVNVRTLKEAGVLAALGCDWAPSGSKNLLGELKVAHLANKSYGSPFTPRELIAMVTINPAKILKWDSQLGTIEPSKLADLVVLSGARGDPYLGLINARETSISLVIIDGLPRLGAPRLMRELGLRRTDAEEIGVAGRKRWFFFSQDVADPLVEGLGLDRAIAILRDAMQRLPELAGMALRNAESGLSTAVADVEQLPWMLTLDLEEEEGVALELAAAVLATITLEPMSLDGMTVADDSAYVPRLLASSNLPDFLKKGLPPLLLGPGRH